jgi:poly(3-hydroxybutyrate) depolymerase
MIGQARQGCLPSPRGERRALPRAAFAARAVTRLITRSLAIWAVLLSTSCGSPAGVPEKGAFLLRIEVPLNGPFPDELRVWVYDATGALFSDVRAPEQGALPAPSKGDVGSILIQPGMAQGTLRIHVRGLVASTRRLDGVTSLGPADRDGSTVRLALSTDLLADGDSDDVPDSIDDCRAVFNPDQGGCPAQVKDASAGADAPADAAKPVDGSADSTAISDAQAADTRPPQDAGQGGGIDRPVNDSAAQDSAAADSSPVDGASPADGAVVPMDAGLPVGGSAGCGIAATGVAEGLVNLTLTEGGAAVARQFWLSRPSSYDPRRAYKLVVGIGSSASSADVVRTQLGVQGTGVTPQADEIFVYPLARIRTFGTWGTRLGWQLGPGARDTNAAGLDDLAFIDAMLDDVTRRHCIDKQKVFVAGHGWGSDFTHALACLRGNVIHAVTGSATNGDYYLLNPTVACVGLAGTFTLHGKGDTALPLATGMTALNFWLNQHRCSATTQPLTVPGPNGNEACVRYLGCTAETRWCAYDASFGGGVPSYLGREAMSFFRGF